MFSLNYILKLITFHRVIIIAMLHKSLIPIESYINKLFFSLNFIVKLFLPMSMDYEPNLNYPNPNYL